jgi:hypothetical protein
VTRREQSVRAEPYVHRQVVASLSVIGRRTINADAAKSLASFMLLSLDFIVDQSNKVQLPTASSPHATSSLRAAITVCRHSALGAWIGAAGP